MGIISYIFWEWAFWGMGVPVCIFGYYEVTGHMPDFSNQDDLAKLGAEAFAFVNVARFAIPLRIGLALSTTPWVRDNVVQNIPFLKKKDRVSVRRSPRKAGRPCDTVGRGRLCGSVCGA